MLIEKRLEELGIELPETNMPIANYVLANRVGNVLYLAGMGPSRGKEALYRGKLGESISIEEAYQATRCAAINVLSMIRHELGDLDKVKKIIKMTGYINCTPEFEQQPAVLNGASDLFGEVFGEKGRHARAAIGVNALPMSIPVEIEVMVECEEA